MENRNQELFVNRVFFVDDEESTLSLLKTIVDKNMPEIQASYFNNAQEALIAMQDKIPTIVVTDWQMPEMDGLALTKKIVAQKETLYPFHYIIFLTVREESEDLEKALQEGAHDYIKKPLNAQEIITRIRLGLKTLQLEYKLKSLNNHIETNPALDNLTQAFNKHYGNILLQQELNKVQRNIQEFSVLMIDVDHCKAIADQYGQEASDHILKEVSSRIQSAERSYDSLIRWDHDKFLLACPYLQRDDAIEVANRILLMVSGRAISINDDDEEIQATISIGIASLDRGEIVTPEELVEQAESTLQQAKANGRNQIQVFLEN